MEGPKVIQKLQHEPYKVCAVGTTCGKSCLILRFLKGNFEEDVDPTIEDNYQYTVKDNEKEIPLHILDTAGTSSFTLLEEKVFFLFFAQTETVVDNEQWFRWGDLYLLCYSVSSRYSFEILLAYYQHIKKIKNSFPLILVATQCMFFKRNDYSIICWMTSTKADREDSRQVKMEEGKRLAEEWDCPFFETSAKCGTNVDTVFKCVAQTLECWRMKERRKDAGANLLNEFKQLDKLPKKKLNSSPSWSSFSLKQEAPKSKPPSGSLFGVPIDSLPKTVNPFVPDFVLKVFDYLRKTGPLRHCHVLIERSQYFTDAVRVEGLFRVSATASSVSEIKALLNKGEDVDFTKIRPCDCHVVAGLFKAWLKELPVPLLTFDLYSKFVSAFATLGDSNAVYKIDKLLNKLPQTNYHVFWELLDFVGEMLQHVTENKMSPANLSTVFGPCICFPKSQDPLKQLEDLKCVNGTIQFIFQHYSELKELQDISSLTDVQLRTPKSTKPKAEASSPLKKAKAQWRKTVAVGATAVMSHLLKSPSTTTRKSLPSPTDKKFEHMKAVSAPPSPEKKDKKKFFTMRL